MDRDLIFFSCIIQKPEFHYEIYAVDIGKSKSNLTTLRPSVIVKFSKGFWKLCVISSILYLFCEDGRSATFDLSLLREDEPVVLDEEATFKYIATMKRRKCGLEAIPTPGGKVIAFSKHIAFGNTSDFEVYDPATGCWDDIPPIHLHLPDISIYKTINISSYTFSDESTLVIESGSGERFLLFLKYPVSLSRWHGPLSPGEMFPFHGFSRGIVSGSYQLCFTGTLVWDIQNSSGVKKAVLRFPDFQNNPSSKTKSRMIIFGRKESCCYHLEITKKRDHDQSTPIYHLQIQEYYLDLVDYFKEKKGQEEKFDEEMQLVVDGSWEQENLVNQMMVTSPQLGCCPLSSSSFLFPPGISPILDELTFHQC